MVRRRPGRQSSRSGHFGPWLWRGVVFRLSGYPIVRRSASMAAPILVGLHHLKLPVSDLDASLDWDARVLGAEHQPQFDRVDDDGTRYAAIMTVPGLPVPLELRWAPAAAEAMDGYDP